MPLTHGNTVVDLGAGGGHWTIPLAKMVGPKGRVYAIEVQKEMIPVLKRNLQEASVRNATILWGDIEEPGGTKLADRSCDAVVMASVLFQLENKKDAAEETRRLLRPGGKVLVVDWKKQVNKETVKEIFKNVSFKLIEEFDAGRDQFGIIFGV